MGSHGSPEASYEAFLEPMNMASLADMTRKLAFLLTLASARRNSEASAFRAVVHFRQAVVSARNVWPKTTDPSKPSPEHKFRSLLCVFIGGTWVIYPSRQCQVGSDIGFQRLQNIINVYTYGHTPNGTVYTIAL